MLPEPPRPSRRFLYRYGSTAGERLRWLEPVITAHKIYLPEAGLLNDADDCRPSLKSVPPESYAAFLKRKRSWEQDVRQPLATVMTQVTGEERLRRWVTAALHEYLGKTRVYSMSSTWDNTELWKRYGDGHKGYCLEFRNAGFLEKLARQVIYFDVLPELDVGDPDHETHTWLFYKTAAKWSIEDEIRVVLSRETWEHRSEWTIDADLLSSITLGSAISSSDEAEIRAWCTARTPPLKVFKTAFDPSTNRLTRA